MAFQETGRSILNRPTSLSESRISGSQIRTQGQVTDEPKPQPAVITSKLHFGETHRRSGRVVTTGAAAVGAAVFALSGCAGTDGQVYPPESHAVTSGSQAKSQESSAQKPLRFNPEQTLLSTPGNDGIPVAVILQVENGVSTEGTAYNSQNVNTAYKKVETYSKHKPEVSLPLGEGPAADSLTFTITPAERVQRHVFKIVKDVKDVGVDISGSANPDAKAFTVIKPDNPALRESYFELGVGKRKVGKMNLDGSVYGLAVEAFNNTVDMVPTDHTRLRILTIAPNNPDAAMQLAARIVQEIASNSYGAAVAARVSGLSYPDYVTGIKDSHMDITLNGKVSSAAYTVMSVSDYSQL